MNTNEMTTKQLNDELENTKKNFDCKSETWEKIFAIEKELQNRNALPVHTYDF